MSLNPDEIRSAVRTVLPSVRADLEDLVRIPSVSADPARRDDVRRCADATARGHLVLYQVYGQSTAVAYGTQIPGYNPVDSNSGSPSPSRSRTL